MLAPLRVLRRREVDVFARVRPWPWLLFGVVTMSTAPLAGEGPGEKHALNQFFQSLPDWTIEPPAPYYVQKANTLKLTYDYKCQPSVQELDKIVFDSDVVTSIWPGVILQGKTIDTGNPSSLNLPRAPLSLRLDYPMPGVAVAKPSADPVRDAVATLQTALAKRGQTRSNYDYEMSEVTNFEEQMAEMSISASYAEAFKGAIGGGYETSVASRTVIMKLIDTMFTVSFDDSTIRSPSEFFEGSVKVADVQSARIGPQNLPLYVTSVQYGRVFMATITASEGVSMSDLKASVNGAYDGVSGGAKLSTKYRNILSASTVRQFVRGASRDFDLRKALLDPSEAIGKADVMLVVPISFQVKALKDQAAVKIADAFSTGFVPSLCKAATSYTVHLLLKSVNTTGSDCDLPGWYGADYDYWYSTDWSDSGSGRLAGWTYTLTSKPIPVNRDFGPIVIDGPDPDEGKELLLQVYGEQSMCQPIVLCSLSAKKAFQRYPFGDIPSTPGSFEFSLDTAGPSTCPARWTFAVSKAANY